MAFTVEHAKAMRAAYRKVSGKQVVQIGHQGCSGACSRAAPATTPWRGFKGPWMDKTLPPERRADLLLEQRARRFEQHPLPAPTPAFPHLRLMELQSPRVSAYMGGNVYFNGARFYFKENGALDLREVDREPRIVEEGERVYLRLRLGSGIYKAATRLVNTELLGKARVPELPYENADGSPLAIDVDYSGSKRNVTAPSAGPFESPGQGELKLRVWSGGLSCLT